MATAQQARGPEKKLPQVLWNRILNFIKFSDVLERWEEEQEAKETNITQVKDLELK